MKVVKLFIFSYIIEQAFNQNKNKIVLYNSLHIKTFSDS